MFYTFKMTTIIGLKLSNRLETAIEFQRILSEFGCEIKSRIGLHQIQDRFCSADGIILLEIPNNKAAIELEKNLLKINGIEIQEMIFN